MKIDTAIKQLNKEQEFLGIGLLELLQDIQKHGRMIYSERTMDAYGVFMAEGVKLFSSTDEFRSFPYL
jgi:hypothetical protein